MSKEITASYEPHKRLLPVVLLPFARDATSAYKRLARRHKNRHNRYESNDRSHRKDHIPTSKLRSGNEFVCEYML